MLAFLDRFGELHSPAEQYSRNANESRDSKNEKMLQISGFELNQEFGGGAKFGWTR